MDYIWSPWRYRYVADDRQTLIVLRAEKNFIILNRYPYTSGHVMIVPYVHSADLGAISPEALAEMMFLAQRTQKALQQLYHPEGYNLGMNLGRAAGAGITGHLHLHVLPRWSGDSSFMTVIGETRMEPEELSTTYERLHKALS